MNNISSSWNSQAISFNQFSDFQTTPLSLSSVKPGESSISQNLQLANLPAALNPTRAGNTTPLPSLMRDSGNLSVDKKQNEITTAGGYKIKATGKDQQVVITTPEGKKIDVHGDPHVKTSDGSDFQIKDDSTIQLKDGTVVALNNEPKSDKPGAATYVRDVTVFSANGQHAQISGIDQDQPQTGDAQRTPANFSLGSSFKADDAYVLTADEGGLAQLNSGRKVTGSKDHGAFQTFGDQVETANPSFNRGANRFSGVSGSFNRGSASEPEFANALNNLNQLMSQLANGAGGGNRGTGFSNAGFNPFSFVPGGGDSTSPADLLRSTLNLMSEMLSTMGSLMETNNQPISLRFTQMTV